MWNEKQAGEYTESDFIISGITLSSVITSVVKTSYKVAELIHCSSSPPFFLIGWLYHISVGSCTVYDD